VQVEIPEQVDLDQLKGMGDLPVAVPGVHNAIPEAEARVGRPLTPVSVAGVARRTVRPWVPS
jgi:hypothetical protein